jgi:uncharacterized membrane protein YqaE (UPF0057 family)
MGSKQLFILTKNISMKNNVKFLCFYLSMAIMTPVGSYAAKPLENSSPASCETSFTLKEKPKKDNQSIKAERKKTKLVKDEIKEKLRDAKKNKGGVDPVLMIILAIFLPPVAVYLLEEFSINFWIDLLLTLLFFLPGMIYALYLVLKDQGKI